MSTIKVNELAESNINLEDLIAKADENGLLTKTTIQRLSTFLQTVSNSGLRETIINTDAAPTTDGVYPCRNAGVYTDFGGLTVDLNNKLVYISVENNQTEFYLIEIPIYFSVDNSPTKSSINLVTSGGIFDNDFLNLLNYPSFVMYEDTDINDLLNIYSQSLAPNHYKGEIYQSFKSIELSGFDKTKPHKVRTIWNDAYNSTGHNYFRLIISSLENGSWVNVFDSTALEMPDIGLQNDRIGVFDKEIQGKRVRTQIDFSKIPANTFPNLDLNTPTMVISDNCFIDSFEDLYPDESVAVSAIYQNIVKDYVPGFVNLSGEFISPASYKVYLIPVLEGDNITCEVAGSQNTLVVSAYSDSTQESFITGSDLNIKGDIDSTKNIIHSFTVPNGVNYIRVGNNDAGDDLIAYKGEFAKLEKSISYLEKTNIDLKNSNKEVFNSRRKPTISFIWDDLNDTDSLVYDVFKDYGYLPSYAIKTNNITEDNIKFYLEKYTLGCSILAHSVTHPNMSTASSLTPAQAEGEMIDSKKHLESLGFKISGWVTPQSNLNPLFLDSMIKNFGYGYTGLNNGLFNETVDPVKMNRVGIESEMINGTGMQGLKDRIDQAIANNEFIVFYGHKLPSTYTNSSGDSYFSEIELRELLTYLKSKSDNSLCQVMPTDEAVISYYKTPVIT